MRFISLFAGVGGFDLGFERAGHECVLQVEKDQHCLEVLRRRWPNVPKMEDVRDVTKQSAPDVDMVIGGFPCQDVSISGGRRGLDGGRSRSGLWFEFHRILRELRPRIAVVENVPGLFSSNGGNDFATILRGLSEQRYMSAWRVLDAQYFGVPQRRRRVFFVASLGDGACAEILFERESVRRDTAKSRKTRPGAAGEPQGRPGGVEPVIADPLRSGGDGLPPSPRTPGEVVYNAYSAADRIRGTEGVASTLSGPTYSMNWQSGQDGLHPQEGRTDPVVSNQTIAVYSTPSTEGSGTVNSDGSGNMITGAIPIDMQNAKGVVNPKGAGGIGKDGDPMYTLQSNDRHAVSATVTAKQAGGPAGSASETDNCVIQQSVGPLRATDYKGPRLGDDQKMVIQDTVGTLAPGAHPGGFNGQDAYTGNLIPQGVIQDTAEPLAAALTGSYNADRGDSGDCSKLIPQPQANAVRRLTPVECCRLQGFPDDWNDDQTDSQRYRQMGNAVCVTVAEWLGRRIAEYGE